MFCRRWLPLPKLSYWTFVIECQHSVCCAEIHDANLASIYTATASIYIWARPMKLAARKLVRPAVLTSILLLLLLGLTVWLSSIPGVPDPVHNGKRLSEWLVDLDNRSESSFTSSAVAVHELGTSAIPAIVKMSLTRNSQPKEWLIMQLEKHPKLLPHNYATAARRRERANKALRLIGPPAQDAVPYYLDALTNGDTLTRKLALNALGSMDSWAGEALPTLISLRNDTEIRGNLIATLGHIHQRPDFCVPFFTQALGDTNIVVRRNAAYSLGCFGAEAKVALPALTNALQDPQTAPVAGNAIGTIQSASRITDLE
jgi:hypothetical protein